MIVIFGDHLGRHLGKYATELDDFYIFILYDHHFIWIDTLFVSVYERRAEIHDCNFWRPSWPPSWKICNRSWWFLHIYTLRPSLYMNQHFICLYIQKESWDTLDCNFRRPSWPPSWKICNWCFWFLHIHTLPPSLYMNRHFIRLCIWKDSRDTFDSEFQRPCWPPSWKNFFFHIFPNSWPYMWYTWKIWLKYSQ